MANRENRALRSGGMVCALALSLCASARGQVAFTKVIDSQTPGFTGLNDLPSIDNGSVVFGNNAGTKGVFRWSNGVVTPVATGALPGAPAGFTLDSIESPVISGNEVAFTAVSRNASGATFSGVYGTFGGALSRVADQATVVPGSAGTFTGFSRVERSGDRLVFLNSQGLTAGGIRPKLSEGTGIYLAQGSGNLSTVADTSTPIPNGLGANFSHLFDNFDVDATRVLFAGEGGDTSNLVYVHTNTALVRAGGVLGTDAGRFLPDIDANNYAFSTSVLLEAALGGSLRHLPKESLQLPGFNPPNNNWVLHDTVSLSNANVVIGTLPSSGSPDVSSIYIYNGDTFQRIIGLGDTINGFIVSKLQFSPNSLSGNQFVFWAQTTEPAGLVRSIYVATVPEPAGMIAGISVAGLMVRRRRRA